MITDALKLPDNNMLVPAGFKGWGKVGFISSAGFVVWLRKTLNQVTYGTPGAEETAPADA